MPNPRKPSHLKLIQGTQKKCRANPNEPKPTRSRITAPKHLTKEARSAWSKFAALLDDMGVLTVADGAALEGLCETYAELIRARASLKARGADTYESVTATGGFKITPYPELALISDADRRLRAWLGLFGLTPADRSRVSAGKAPEHNPFAALG